MADNKAQIEIAERLQVKMLKRWETLLDNDLLSPTDAATLARLLAQNGWSLDPQKLPEGLRSKLTEHIDPREFSEDDFQGH